MNEHEPNKIIALATVAMALSGSVQAILAFKQLSTLTKGWLDIAALAATGFLVVALVVLSTKSWRLINQK